MCDDNRKTFIATLYNVILAPDLCNRLFSIITLMNAGNTCLFHKGFCTVYFEAEKKNAVTLPHSAQRKHAFLGKIKDMSNKNKLPARNKLLLNYYIIDYDTDPPYHCYMGILQMFGKM